MSDLDKNRDSESIIEEDDGDQGRVEDEIKLTLDTPETIPLEKDEVAVTAGENASEESASEADELEAEEEALEDNDLQTALESTLGDIILTEEFQSVAQQLPPGLEAFFADPEVMAQLLKNEISDKALGFEVDIDTDIDPEKELLSVYEGLDADDIESSYDDTIDPLEAVAGVLGSFIDGKDDPFKGKNPAQWNYGEMKANEPDGKEGAQSTKISLVKSFAAAGAAALTVTAMNKKNEALAQPDNGTNKLLNNDKVTMASSGKDGEMKAREEKIRNETTARQAKRTQDTQKELSRKMVLQKKEQQDQSRKQAQAQDEAKNFYKTKNNPDDAWEEFAEQAGEHHYGIEEHQQERDALDIEHPMYAKIDENKISTTMPQQSQNDVQMMLENMELMRQQQQEQQMEIKTSAIPEAERVRPQDLTGGPGMG